MELLLTGAAVALVIVAFAVADYLDAKAQALRGHCPDKAPSAEDK